MIKLEHFRVFLAVADKQSLSEAAQLINRTPAAISMTLKQMEEFLNAPLFEGERKNQLTKLGIYVMEKARNAVSEHDKSLADVIRYARGEEGVVRIAVVPSIARKILPKVISNLQNISELNIEIRDTDSESVGASVLSGAVDFGIAGKSITSNNLQSTLLLDETFGVICRLDHPLVKLKRPILWKDLAKYPFISNGLCQRINVPSVNILVDKSNLFLHNITTLYAFIEQGLGTTLLPQLSFENTEKIISLPLDDLRIKRSLYLFKRNREQLTPVAKKLISEIINQLNISTDYK